MHLIASRLCFYHKLKDKFSKSFLMKNLIIPFRRVTHTVNSLSETPGHSERTRWDGSCNSPLGFLTVAHDILYF
jgi:hypothetical protein